MLLMNVSGMALPRTLKVCSAKLHVKVIAFQPWRSVWLAVCALHMYVCLYWEYMLSLTPGWTWEHTTAAASNLWDWDRRSPLDLRLHHV